MDLTVFKKWRQTRNAKLEEHQKFLRANRELINAKRRQDKQQDNIEYA